MTSEQWFWFFAIVGLVAGFCTLTHRPATPPRDRFGRVVAKVFEPIPAPVAPPRKYKGQAQPGDYRIRPGENGRFTPEVLTYWTYRQKPEDPKGLKWRTLYSIGGEKDIESYASVEECKAVIDRDFALALQSRTASQASREWRRNHPPVPYKPDPDDYDGSIPDKSPPPEWG